MIPPKGWAHRRLARPCAGAARGSRPGSSFVDGMTRAPGRNARNLRRQRRRPRSGQIRAIRIKDPYCRRLQHRWPSDAVGPRVSNRNGGTLMLREQHRRANVAPAGGRATATESQRCCCFGETSLLSGGPHETSGGQAQPKIDSSRPVTVTPEDPHRWPGPARPGPAPARPGPAPARPGPGPGPARR